SMAGVRESSAPSTDRSRKTRPSSTPHTSKLSVPGSIPITRGTDGHPPPWTGPRPSESPGHGVDRVDVEDLVVPLEEPGHAGPVDLHLETSDTEGAEDDLAGPLVPLVTRFDSLDAQRGHGIDVGHRLQRRMRLPDGTRQ